MLIVHPSSDLEKSDIPRAEMQIWFEALSLLLPKRINLYLNHPNLDEMKRINFTYRKKNQATNVLSFVYDESPQAIDGEILICPQVVIEESTAHDVDPKGYYLSLLVHGLLHLLGYDHETEEERQCMEELENAWLKKLSCPISWEG